MKKLFLTAVLIPAILGLLPPLLAVPQSSAVEFKRLSPAPGQGIRFRNNLISLDLREADISDVLREIAQKAKIDIALGDGVGGKVSIKLTDVTIEEALKQLCRSNALVYEYLPDTKTYRIVQALALARTKEPGGSKTTASAGDGPAAQRSWPEGYSDNAGIRRETPATQRDSRSETDKRGRPRYRPGELLIKFKPGATDRQIEDLHRSLGSRVVGSIKKLRLQRIKLKEGFPEQEAMALYGAAEIVENVEKHALRYPNLVPNDPDVYRQWGLTNIKAREAWDINRGAPEVVVAIIDTGVDYLHPDLKDNIWINEAELNGLPGVDDDGNGYVDDIRGWDFAGNVGVTTKDDIKYEPDNDPMDVNGHGTHVAGIIAAGGNNGLGIAGINWQVKILPLKVQADDTDYFEDFAIIDAIQYAIAQGAKIVNCSFGGTDKSVNEENAFTTLKNAGVLAVAAAGNDALDTDIAGQENYPSGYDLDNIISVAANNANDGLASFSNYGLASVDVLAPGENIYSTVPEATAALVKIGGPVPAEYPAIGMEFAGRTDENGITAILYDSGLGYPEQFPAGVAGNIALIERGGLYFSEKVLNAQVAGAAGVIVYNNVDGDFSGTLQTPGNWVPAVSITKADGEALKTQGAAVVTLINKLALTPYDFKSGTSMAAPHVTGLAGLILAQCSSLEYADIKSAILNTVDKIAAVADKIGSGGRVNALAALKSIFLPGDLTGDCRIGLDDAILVWQVLSGLSPQNSQSCSSCEKDVNGDRKIGIEEAIFILQKAAGVR